MTNKTLSLVVTGMHRSGTTWIGKVVDKLPEVTMLDEPFNAGTGLRGVRCFYLDPSRPDDVGFLNDALSRLENGTAKFRRIMDLRRGFARFALVALRGTGLERSYKTFLRSPVANFGIKDPFLVMFTRFFDMRDVPVIVTVRHPAAILQSLKRMGWEIPLANFKASIPDDEYALLLQDEHRAICKCWQIIYAPVLQHLRDHGSDRVFLAIHEVIFEDVQRFHDDLMAFLKVPNPENNGDLIDFLKQSTNATTVRPSHARQHDLARDSRSLARNWRNSLDAETLKIYDDMIGAQYDELLEFSGANQPVALGSAV